MHSDARRMADLLFAFRLQERRSDSTVGVVQPAAESGVARPRGVHRRSPLRRVHASASERYVLLRQKRARGGSAALTTSSRWWDDGKTGAASSTTLPRSADNAFPYFFATIRAPLAGLADDY